ncbi:S-4TM family putative pore-forming effector [Dactylosporangium sp. NPDC005572]|uniref:S-4TM family putative pore-forming effector n=1 Tax=Dactylosporangium sp. NPDC005572 TaxID=3156889 RepID=UPI0033A1EB84
MTDSGGLAQRQNSPTSIVLLRAIAVAHRQAHRAHAAALLVSVAVAGLGAVSRAAPDKVGTVTLAGAVWAGVYAAVVAPWAGRHQRTSATLQEMFDVALFDLPWNRVLVGEPVAEDEWNRLSRRFRGDEARLRDYYLVANVRSPYEVMFCLEQSLAWGSRVRQRYATLLLGLAGLWCAAGVVVTFVNGSKVVDLVSGWLVPSLGLVLFCLDQYRAQAGNTRERKRVLDLLRAADADQAEPALRPGPAWTALARQIQDVQYLMRRQQPRVPVWLFRRFHDDDMADFRFKMQVLEARVGSEPSPTPPA